MPNDLTLLRYLCLVETYMQMEYPEADEFIFQMQIVLPARERFSRIVWDCLLAGESPQMCCSLLAQECRSYQS